MLTDHRNLFGLTGIRNTDAVYQEFVMIQRSALLSLCETNTPALRRAVNRAFKRRAQESNHEAQC